MTNQPSSSFMHRLPAWALFLTATLGVPGAAAIAFADQVAQHPVLAVGIALLYEVVVFLAGFSAKVWQRMESKLVDRTAEALDEALQRLVSRYRTRYLKHLVYRHRNFDVKGLGTQGIYTLELEQVFVELSIAPRAPHMLSADPIAALPPELQEGRHSVWEYLDAKQLALQNLVIVGPPGCGKTTLLKHMALTLAVGPGRGQHAAAPDRLPILLFLRDHAAAIAENPDLTLDQAVQSTLERWKLVAPPKWFETQLAKGRCLVMLDGLDEVVDPQARQRVVAWVEQQMEIYSRNRFVVTSRPHGYRANPIAGVTVLAVLPFTRPQIERFVHNWYTANEIMSQQKDDPGVRMAAQEGSEDLLQRLRNAPALADLAVNPLLLTMIATVHRYRSTLPGRRVELYAEICEVFLGKRQQARGMELDLTPAQKQRVLQPLAYHLMVQEAREIAVDRAEAVIAEVLALVSPQTAAADFLKMVENSSGLVAERESGVYGFTHLTFQEYLAAVHVQEQRLEAELIMRVADPWWHEVIRLYAAKADATPVIAACLADDPPAIPALILALECREEAREVQPEVRARLDEILDHGVEDPDPERRRIIVEVLLSLRLRNMIPIDDTTHVDTSLITLSEYQLFLDEKQGLGEFYQPDHWVSYRFPVGQGRRPVVGVRPADAVEFCHWLTARETNLWQYRLPLASDLKTTCLGGAGLSYWVSTANGYALEREGQPYPKVMLASDMLSDRIARDILVIGDLFSDRVVAGNLAGDFAKYLIGDLTHGSDNAMDLDYGGEYGISSNLYPDKLALQFICNVSRSLTHARDLDRALAHTLDIGFANVLNLFRNIQLAQDLVRGITRAVQLAQDLNLDLINMRYNVLDIERNREVHRALARTRDLARDRNLKSTLSINRDRANAFARELDLARDRVLALNLARVRDRERARALAHDLTHNRDLVLDLASALGRASESAGKLHSELTREDDSGYGFDLGFNLDFDRVRIHSRSLDLLGSAPELYRGYSPMIGSSEVRGALARVRWLALGIASVEQALLNERSKPSTESVNSNDKGTDYRDWLARRIELYLDLCVDLVVLEERILENLQPFEGIRIVKERK